MFTEQLSLSGILLIAEVRSRFENFHDFIELLVEAGFQYDKSVCVLLLTT